MAISLSSKKKSLSLGCTIMFLIPFLAAGLGLMGYGVYLLGRGYAAQSWPIAEGVVTRSEAKTGRDSDGDATEETDIHYAYAWQGRKLEGTTIRMGGDVKVNGKTSGLAEDLAKYPVGKAVQVRVDPAHPETSVLESGVAWMPVLFFIVFGAFFGGIPGLMLFVAIRQSRKKEEEAPAADVIAFDAEQAGGAPAAVEWTPLKGAGGANFQTSRLKEQKDGSWKVAPTVGMWAFALLFTVMGMAAVALGAGLVVWGIGKEMPLWPKLIPLAVGSLFMLAGVAMIRGMLRSAAFAPGERMCRGLVEDPSKFRKVRGDVPFSQVIGVQVVSQQHSGDSDSSPYTSYQLNLVLKDFTRRNVMGHGNQAALEKDADMLAQMLRVPVWNQA